MDVLGRTLDNRYEVMEKIGEGGMSRVYKGLDKKLNRIVAVKVLYEQFAGDPEFLRRFKMEAKAAAKLLHPSIVNVYDEGESQGIHYIIMEYVEGFTIKEIIQRQGRLRPQDAAQLVLQVCDALVHAHAHKVIHRDIKPQNIIITSDGRAKVTDFGIARAAANATITHGRSLMGSVYYSSPEQARGNFASEQSDIYSLGVVLYEMVTGTLPFSGESPVSVALKHLQEDLVPPRELVPDIPREMEMIIFRSMHKDPHLRYASAVELRNDLDEWLSGLEKDNLGSSSLLKRLHSYGLQSVRQDNDGYRSYSQNEYFQNEESEDDEEAMSDSNLPWKKVIIYGVVLGIVVLLLFNGYQFLRSSFIVPEVEVPDLVGMSLNDVEQELASLELGYIIIDELHSDTVPEGYVISQDPPARRSVKQDRVIDLVLSKGVDEIEVPDLVGRSELESRIILNDADFEVDITHEYSENVESGYVIRQDPSKDFRLAKGDTVRLVISEGKRPFSLRDFKGWSLEDAKEWMDLNGLVLGDVREEYSDEYDEGQVLSQYPAAGEEVRSGNSVDFVLSKGAEPETYESYEYRIQPEVPEGNIIMVYIEDVEGKRTIFEGEYQGEVISAEGIGEGQIVLMELRDDEYYTIDVLEFP